MKLFKKNLGMIIAVVMTLSAYTSVGVESVIASDVTAEDVTIQNVRFMVDGAEVFTIGEVENGKNVTADVVLNCPKGIEDGALSTILASYDSEGRLTDVKVDSYNSDEVIQGMPTISTSAISMDENIDELRLFVWNNLDDMKPMDEVHTLNSESRDTRIANFAVTLNDSDSTPHTYGGLINHDTKQIRVYVPTSQFSSTDKFAPNHNNAESGDSMNTFYGSSVDTDFTDNSYSKMKLADFKTAIGIDTDQVNPEKATINAVPVTGASIIETRTSRPENGVRRFTYTVVAENGERAVYTADIASLVCDLKTNMTNTRLGTRTTVNLDTTQWQGSDNLNGRWQSADTGEHRAGMPNNKSKDGVGNWQHYYQNRDKNVLFNGTISGGLAYVNGYQEKSPIKVKIDQDNVYGHGGYTTFTMDDANAKEAYNGGAYNIRFGYYSKAMIARTEMVAVMDYKIEKNDKDAPEGNVFVRMFDGQSDVGDADLSSKGPEIRLNSNSIALRAVPNDGTWDSKKSDGNGYTKTVGSANLATTESGWHRLEMVSSIMPEFKRMAIAEGMYSYGVLTEIYLDGVYRGYTYKVDYTNSNGYLSGQGGQGALLFTFGNNTDMNFSLDNVIWGTPFNGTND